MKAKIVLTNNKEIILTLFEKMHLIRSKTLKN